MVETHAIRFVLRLSELTDNFESEVTVMDIFTIVCHQNVDCW